MAEPDRPPPPLPTNYPWPQTAPPVVNQPPPTVLNQPPPPVMNQPPPPVVNQPPPPVMSQPPPSVLSQPWRYAPTAFPPPILYPNAWTGPTTYPPTVSNGMWNYPVPQGKGTVAPAAMPFSTPPSPAMGSNAPCTFQPPIDVAPSSSLPSCPMPPLSTAPMDLPPLPPLDLPPPVVPLDPPPLVMPLDHPPLVTSGCSTSKSKATPSTSSVLTQEGNGKSDTHSSTDPRINSKRLRTSSPEEREAKYSRHHSHERSFVDKDFHKTKDKVYKYDGSKDKDSDYRKDNDYNFDHKKDRGYNSSHRKDKCSRSSSKSAKEDANLTNGDLKLAKKKKPESKDIRSGKIAIKEEKAVSHSRWSSSHRHSDDYKKERNFERSRRSSSRYSRSSSRRLSGDERVEENIKNHRSNRSKSHSRQFPGDLKSDRSPKKASRSHVSSHKEVKRSDAWPADRNKKRRDSHKSSSGSIKIEKISEKRDIIDIKAQKIHSESKKDDSVVASVCEKSSLTSETSQLSFAMKHSMDPEDHSQDSKIQDASLVDSSVEVNESNSISLSVSNSEKTVDQRNEDVKVELSCVSTVPSLVDGKNQSDSKKPSSSDFKSPAAKLKLYDDIWRKIRGKSKAHLKSSSILNKKNTTAPVKSCDDKKKLLPVASKEQEKNKQTENIREPSKSPRKKSSEAKENKDVSKLNNVGKISSRSTSISSPKKERKESPKKKPIRCSSSMSRALTPSSSGRRSNSNVKLKSLRRSLSVRRSERDSREKSLKPIRRTSTPSRNRENKGRSTHSSVRTRDVKSRSREVSRRPRSRERSETSEDQPSLSTEPSKFIKSSPSELYYSKVQEDSKEVAATDALKELHKKFQYELVERAQRAKAERPKYDPPIRKTKLRKHKPIDLNSESESSNSSEESSSEEEDTAMEELEKKRSHPDRLHPELWFNDPKEMNDGPLCRCSAKARRSGIRHGIYVGENHLPACEPHSNNAKKLHHYKICVTPVTNFLTKSPTVIVHGGEKYIFEGFSMFSHKPLPKLPNCKVIRFNYEYTLMYVEEEMPENFTVAGLELFNQFLLGEILELVDIDWNAHDDRLGCPQFHFMPRFSKTLKDDGKELLSLNVVLEYLLKSNQSLIKEEQLSEVLEYSSNKWQAQADKVKGMIVTCPGMKPSSIRVDQLDREHIESNQDTKFPVIVHFGVRPPQLSYAGNPLYQKAWRDYVKYRHLLANKPKVRYADRHKLTQKEMKLQEMRMENDLKRDVTIVISSKDFFQTGIMSDMVQHAMLLPVMVCHLRFHASLSNLEEKIGYKFMDRFLLQLALTHPSYRENFGTNPDHARNSLTNCGLRQPQYGDRRIHYMNTRKRGINTLINIMSRFGNQQESASSIHHNERLEFLGDAVVEFLSSIHLFYMFPDLEEGGLATYRAAIVQNQHLAVLARKLELEKFMLYAHGSDLCHDLELKHAMANCFEALMGALFLDAGIEVADKVFSKTLFPEKELQEVWKNYPLHPLQEQEPGGDRQWIELVPLLQKLHEFEEQIGIEFTHIRLLARALTHRSLGYNNLTLGSNQRLEFLGDTVLQLVASEYLYKFFPQHHEGHLSLLRSSLVNNRTQAVVCGDLGMVDYAIYPYFKVELKPKDKADLLEAFLGALYVDKDLGYCRKFCEVCFFPRLQDFIMNQDWNDPKSKLQQCCLTLRSMDGGEPDIPTYKVIECKGPTNTRVYGVAVYFQGNRLAVGDGHSIQQAEMDAASNALRKSRDLFPQLRHQKRAIERSLNQGKPFKFKKTITRKRAITRKDPESTDKKSSRGTSKKLQDKNSTK